MKTRRSAIRGLALLLAAAFTAGASAQSALPSQATPKVPAPAQAAIAAPTPVVPAQPLVSPAIRTSRLSPAAVSPWYTEMVKMTRAGIGPQAMLAFVESAGTFNLTGDEIVYLHDLGAPSGIITAMLQHDLDIASGALPLPATAVPQLPPPLKTVKVTVTNAPAAIAATKPAVTAAPTAQPSVVTDSNLDNEWGAEDAAADEPLAPPGFSPVRKPYPVPLTNPIIVVRAPARIANVVTIQMP